MPLNLYQHDNGVWYVRGTVTVWRGGQSRSVPVHKSTRCRDEAQADAVKRQIEGEVAERNTRCSIPRPGRRPKLFTKLTARANGSAFGTTWLTRC